MPISHHTASFQSLISSCVHSSKTQIPRSPFKSSVLRHSYNFSSSTRPPLSFVSLCRASFPKDRKSTTTTTTTKFCQLSSSSHSFFSTSASNLESRKSSSSFGNRNDGKVVVDLSDHPIIKRIPKFLHPYTVGFLNAPVSHITSFVIIHEITAIVPLFGLWGLFYYFDFTPVASIPEWMLTKGTHFIDNLAERNNWTSLKTETGANIVLQGAIAYTIVKVILPFRAAFSLYCMPWGARWLVAPFSRLFNRGGHDKPTLFSTSHSNGSKSTTSSSLGKKTSSTPASPIADPKGQLWTQDLPSEPPQVKSRTSNFNRPKL